MKFALVMKQEGYGCDYSIGCGLRYHPLKATTLEAARAEAKQYLQGVPHDGYTCGHEDCHLVDHDFGTNDKGPFNPKLEFVDLVSVEERLPIQAWFDESVAWHLEYQKQKDEAKERAEYERLAAKFSR